MIRARVQRSRAAVLILVLGILALLTFVAAAFQALTTVETRATSNYRDGERARYAALSGIERAKYKLRRAVSTPGYPTVWAMPDQYDYSLASPGNWLENNFFTNTYPLYHSVPRHAADPAARAGLRLRHPDRRRRALDRAVVRAAAQPVAERFRRSHGHDDDGHGNHQPQPSPLAVGHRRRELLHRSDEQSLQGRLLLAPGLAGEHADLPQRPQSQHAAPCSRRSPRSSFRERARERWLRALARRSSRRVPGPVSRGRPISRGSPPSRRAVEPHDAAGAAARALHSRIAGRQEGHRTSDAGSHPDLTLRPRSPIDMNWRPTRSSSRSSARAARRAT